LTFERFGLNNQRSEIYLTSFTTNLSKTGKCQMYFTLGYSILYLMLLDVLNNKHINNVCIEFITFKNCQLTDDLILSHELKSDLRSIAYQSSSTKFDSGTIGELFLNIGTAEQIPVHFNIINSKQVHEIKPKPIVKE
jgi:hypothetical protein